MEELQKIIETRFIHNESIRVLYNFSTVRLYKENNLEALSSLLSDIFLSEQQKHDILDIFCNIQKFINAILRLKYVWRFKKAKFYNTDDLYMNPITCSQKNTIILLQNNTKYIFTIREVMGTLNNSLANCSHFFTEPIVMKNPYTNIPFTKSALYNIYFAIKSSNYIMPILIAKYFASNFDLTVFSDLNEHHINEEYLRTYVENAYENCRQKVHKMFMDHTLIIRIHKEFPNDLLFKIMKPYLNLYYMSNYSFNENIKIDSFRNLHRQLHDFMIFNRNFGRRKARLVPVKPFSRCKKVEYYFNDSHLPFNYTINKNSFMSSHLSKKNYNVLPIYTHTSFYNEIGSDSDNETIVETSDEED